MDERSWSHVRYVVLVRVYECKQTGAFFPILFLGLGLSGRAPPPDCFCRSCPRCLLPRSCTVEKEWSGVAHPGWVVDLPTLPYRNVFVDGPGGGVGLLFLKTPKALGRDTLSSHECGERTFYVW